MMAYPKWARKCNRVAMATAVSFCSVAFCAGQADFVTSVTSTHPIAYYRLDATSGKSQVGVSTYKSQGGASQGRGSLPTGLSTYVQLDGHDGWILSTQKGGVTTAASIMAWINLADLPSKTGRIFYVAGESQSGNDLDVQIEQDDVLRFFTAGGGNLQFKPEQASLLNQWHMIVATLDTVSKARSLYWDGKQVAHDMGGGTSNKQNAFSIGASTTWGDRWLKGGVAEAALWNRALKAAEVTSIYASANGAASGVAPAHAASTGSGAAASGTGPFATTAKIEINDTKGPMQLKRPEQIAILFLTGMEQIERDCQLKVQRACTMAEALSGTVPGEHLKFDPAKTDPNYTYTLSAGGTAWEAHANAKKPGLKSFYFAAQNIGTVTTTYNAAGPAGSTDEHIMDRSVEGDLFSVQ